MVLILNRGLSPSSLLPPSLLPPSLLPLSGLRCQVRIQFLSIMYYPPLLLISAAHSLLWLSTHSRCLMASLNTRIAQGLSRPATGKRKLILDDNSDKESTRSAPANKTPLTPARKGQSRVLNPRVTAQPGNLGRSLLHSRGKRQFFPQICGIPVFYHSKGFEVKTKSLTQNAQLRQQLCAVIGAAADVVAAVPSPTGPKDETLEFMARVDTLTKKYRERVASPYLHYFIRDLLDHDAVIFEHWELVNPTLLVYDNDGRAKPGKSKQAERKEDRNFLSSLLTFSLSKLYLLFMIAPLAILARILMAPEIISTWESLRTPKMPMLACHVLVLWPVAG